MPDKSNSNNQSTPAGADGQANKQSVRVKKPRRRWGRRILVVLILLCIAIWLLPYIVSTKPGQKVALALVNSAIDETVSLDDLSLNWLGPISAEGVEVVDKDGRTVVKVAEFNYESGGILQLIKAPKRLGRAEIKGIQAFVYLDEVDKEPETKRGRRKRKRSPIPDRGFALPIGDLAILSSSVTLIGSDGKSFEVSEIEGEMNLESPDKLTGQASARFGNVGQLKARMDLSGVSASGDIDDISGTFEVRTIESIDLAGLAQVLGSESPIEAKLDSSLTGTVAGSKIQITFETEIKGLRSIVPGKETRPVDLNLQGAALIKGDSVSVTAELSGTAGQVTAEVEYRIDDEARKFTTDDLWAAIFEGDFKQLPDFTAEASGEIDLVRLGRALPSALKIRHDAEITAGQIEARKIVITGGARPRLQGKVALTGLAAETPAGQIQYQPITLEFDATIQSGKGLVISRFVGKSGFGAVECTGDLNQLSAVFEADLQSLKQKIGPVFDVDLPATGQASGTLQLGRGSDEKLLIEATAQIDQLQLNNEGKVAEVGRVAIKANGSLEIDDRALGELEIKQASITVADVIELSAQGRAQINTGAVNASFEITSSDIGRLAKIAKQLSASDSEAMDGLTGRLVAAGKVSRVKTGGAILSAGAASIHDLAIENHQVSPVDVNLTWSGLKITPTQRFQADSIKLASRVANFEASKLDVVLGEQLRLDGSYNLEADLAETMPFVAALAGEDHPIQWAGQLTARGKFVTTGQRSNLTGDGQIDGLVIRGEKLTHSEPLVEFSQKVRIDNSSDTIRIEKVSVKSQTFTASASGTISDFRETANFDLRGKHRADWGQIMQAVHTLAPATIDTVQINGVSSGPFTLKGPANRMQVTPAYRGLQGKAQMGWDSANVYGLRLGKVAFQPNLSDAQITLDQTAVAASGGQIVFAGKLDLTGAEPVLKIPGTVQILDNVPITEKLSRELISRLNPVMTVDSTLTGNISLETRDIYWPMGEDGLNDASGSGRLEMIDLVVDPQGPLKLLLDLAGFEGQDRTRLRAEGMSFIIRDGRVWYDDLSLMLADGTGLDFAGSVGLDDTVDLTVYIPLTPALLERLGIRIGAAEYMRLLGGMRVPIPIGGTRSMPTIDLSKIKLTDLLQLPRWRNGRDPDDKQPDRPIEDEIERQLEGILRDVLKDVLK